MKIFLDTHGDVWYVWYW